MKSTKGKKTATASEQLQQSQVNFFFLLRCEKKDRHGNRMETTSNETKVTFTAHDFVVELTDRKYKLKNSNTKNGRINKR